jgi:hypothetical protein
MTDTDRTILNSKTIVPEHVLYQEVSGNSALLNLETETYFGLDDVGTQMWEAMEKADTIGAAALALAEIYDAPLETLERDIVTLVAELRQNGLIDFA